MAKKPQSKNKQGSWTKRDSKTGRFVSTKSEVDPLKGVSREAQEFSRRFNEQYRETLRELSKR